MYKKLLSIITITIFVIGLSGCRVPTVPDDCEGAECDASYCELNPTDLTCQNDENTDVDETTLLEDALEAQANVTSFTETTSYYSELGDDVTDIVLEVMYEQDGSNDQFLFHRITNSEHGSFDSYYLYDIEGSMLDYYESYNGSTYYGAQDIDLGEPEDMIVEIEFPDDYTVSETTISTYDYVVYHTTFDTFESLQTVVEGYYNYSILRNVPLTLFVDHLDQLPVDIYIDKDRGMVAEITIDFLPIVNQYRTSVGAPLYDSIDFSITYRNYNETTVDVPTSAQPFVTPPVSFQYPNVPITFDMYHIDFNIDQMLAHPTDTKLFLLDSENYQIHVLDYDTLEDNPIAFDYKPLTMHINGDKLYVGIQRNATVGYDEPTSNNGIVIIYDLETMEEISRIETLYDPGDIAVTPNGQIVVAPATGENAKLMVYNMSGVPVVDVAEMRISDGLQIYVNPLDSRVYVYAYWQGVYDVYDLDEDGHYEGHYRPDDFMTFSSPTPTELYFSPDGYVVFDHIGFVLLTLNDEELDGQRFHILGTNINDMQFDTSSFYVAGDYGVYKFDNETLENQALYSTPLPAELVKVDGNTLITINKVNEGEYVLMTSQIDATCTERPDTASCSDYSVQELTYNGPVLPEVKQEVVDLVEQEHPMDGATFDSIRELDPGHYLITYKTDSTEIIVYVYSDGTSLEDINIKEVTTPDTITEEELRTFMKEMISGTTCDPFIGQAYYLCMEEDVRPYELLDNYYIEINGDSFRYDAIREGYDYLGVFYEGTLTVSDGELYILTLRVTNRSFEEDMDIYAMDLMYDMFQSYSRFEYVEGLCDGYFVNQEQTDYCNQIFEDRFGMGFNWDILWDYEDSGKNAVKLEFSDNTWFRYYFYYDLIIDDNYNLILDFELISVDDPSLEIAESAAVSLTDRFLQGYQEPSSTDYCEAYLSQTNQYLQDMCAIEDTLTFKGARDRPFFDYELVENLGNHEFLIKGFDDEYPDYYELYTVSFVFEDNRWLILDLAWEPFFTYALEDAEAFVTKLFHEVETYNDYEYCAMKQGVTFTNVTDECRINLIEERMEGTRYTVLSITEIRSAEYTITYRKESISSTEIITSDIRFYRGEWGTISFRETVTNTVEEHLIEGTLQERIEARYQAYLIDLFDSNIDSTTVYQTYILPQYDETDYISYRTSLLATTTSISITSIELQVDYRYQYYYDITFDVTDTSGNTTTETISVKLDRSNDILLAPLSLDVTYHVSEDEIHSFIEDMHDSFLSYYFAPFSCEDYVSDNHPLGCGDIDNYAFFEDLLEGPQIITTAENTFTIRYALSGGFVMREYEFVLALEDGTIQLVNHTIVVGE